MVINIFPGPIFFFYKFHIVLLCGFKSISFGANKGESIGGVIVVQFDERVGSVVMINNAPIWKITLSSKHRYKNDYTVKSQPIKSKKDQIIWKEKKSVHQKLHNTV